MNEVQQLEMIESESDTALLLPPEEVRKRYTAAQAEKIAWKLDCILTMLKFDLPAKEIASAAHVAVPTVQTLRARHVEALAADQEKFADYIIRKCGFIFGLALDEVAAMDTSDKFSAVEKLLRRAQEMRLMAGMMTAGEKPAVAETVSENALAAQKWVQEHCGQENE